MVYMRRIDTPLGTMLMRSDGEALTGLWFEGQKYAPELEGADEDLPVFGDTARWLEIYFGGRQPDFTPPLKLEGTPFQRSVWAALLEIPFGQTTTYGAIASRLGIPSAQPIGGAVGHNPVSVIVPCHRVMGSNGSLTGYAGGLSRKRLLLLNEGVQGVPTL